MLRVANIESDIQGRPCSVALLLLVSEHCRCKLFMGADQLSGKLHGILQQLIGNYSSSNGKPTCMRFKGGRAALPCCYLGVADVNYSSDF